jgi:hypothetical protein
LTETICGEEPSFWLRTEWFWEISIQLRCTHRGELVVSSSESVGLIRVDTLNLSISGSIVFHSKHEFLLSSIAKAILSNMLLELELNRCVRASQPC